MRSSWVEKRFENLGEQGFPKALPQPTLLESQMDGSYNVDPYGCRLNELETWNLMAESGEMPDEALTHCATLPSIEYEVSGLLDFEGLEEAKKLLMSPKKRRLEAGLDPMLSKQGPSVEQRRKKNKRRIERISEMNDGVKGSLITMRERAAESYGARHIGLRMIIPRVGRKLSAKKRKLSASEKAKQTFLKAMMRKKAKAKAKAKASPENSAEIEAPLKDQYEFKNFRVTREFEGGQQAYGHEGLCVRADQAEGLPDRLTLVGSDEKGKLNNEIVLAEHCDEVDKMMMKPAQLFSFKHASFGKKLRIL